MEQRAVCVRSRADGHPSRRLPRERTELGSPGHGCSDDPLLHQIARRRSRLRCSRLLPWDCAPPSHVGLWYRLSSSLPIPAVEWLERRGHCVFRLGCWQPDPVGGC